MGGSRATPSRTAAPTIRSRTTLVPIDLRVVDLSGSLVKDLKNEDFTVWHGARDEPGRQVKAWLGLVAAVALAAQNAPPQPPSFRSGIDVVRLDSISL